MNRFKQLLTIFFSVYFLSLGVLAQPAYAADTCNLSLDTQPLPGTDSYNASVQTISVSSGDVIVGDGKATAPNGDTYAIEVNPSGTTLKRTVNIPASSLKNGVLTSIDITNLLQETMESMYGQNPASGARSQVNNFIVNLIRWRPGDWSGNLVVCHTSLKVKYGAQYSCGSPQITLSKTGNQVHVGVGMSGANIDPTREYYGFFNLNGKLVGYSFPLEHERYPNGQETGQLKGGFSDDLPDGEYNLTIGNQNGVRISPDDHSGCVVTATIKSDDIKEVKNEDRQKDIEDGGDNAAATETPAYALCDQIADQNLRIECRQCVTGGGPETKETREGDVSVWTAVGCISLKDRGVGIIQQLVRIGLSLSGGVALLMIITAGFMFTTSQGDPKRAGEARDLMTSSIIGLLFIIFSVIILQFIGVTILRLPQFGT